MWKAGTPLKNSREGRAAKPEKAFSRDATSASGSGSKAEGAKALPVDEHGNLLDGDLGVVGAFQDLKVVVIKQYEFDFKYPRAALEVRYRIEQQQAMSDLSPLEVHWQQWQAACLCLELNCCSVGCTWDVAEIWLPGHDSGSLPNPESPS